MHHVCADAVLGSDECNFKGVREVEMGEKKIKVLLSAYNGEEYIEEQVDSILNQTYQNMELYIRDDGSADGTLAVLQKYRQDSRIHVIAGENVGFIDSFFSLVSQCGEADYYAFSDQDDVWFPEKLAMAVEKLEPEENKHPQEPLLYFSNYDFYDGDMNFRAHAKPITQQPTFRNALVECMSLGFNSVFNKAAHDILCENIPKHSCGHDWWTYMVCVGLGKVIYDDRPTVCYRRNGKNVSPGGMSFFKFQVWRFKKFFKNHYFRNVRRQLREYRSFYGDRLSPENQRLLELFCQEHYSLGNAMRKAFYPKRYRTVWTDEIMVRMIFLIGQL